MAEEPTPSDETQTSRTLSELRKSAAANNTGAPKKQKTPLLHHDDHEHATPAAARAPGRVSRTLVNFWLDGLLGLLFVKLCITAVIVQFVFPPGVAARGASLWGMNYGRWCGLQFGLLAVLALGILLHVMLHWTWICSVLSKRVMKWPEVPDSGLQTVYGVGLLICLLLIGAVTFGIAQWMIVMPE